MKDLLAVKPFRYASRAMQPGDPFSAKDRDARLLIAVKKAIAAPAAGAVGGDGASDEAPPDLATGSEQVELDTLRASYKELFGKAAYHGWDVETLTAKIAAGEAGEGTANG